VNFFTAPITGFLIKRVMSRNVTEHRLPAETRELLHVIHAMMINGQYSVSVIQRRSADIITGTILMIIPLTGTVMLYGLIHVKHAMAQHSPGFRMYLPLASHTGIPVKYATAVLHAQYRLLDTELINQKKASPDGIIITMRMPTRRAAATLPAAVQHATVMEHPADLLLMVRAEISQHMGRPVVIVINI